MIQLTRDDYSKMKEIFLKSLSPSKRKRLQKLNPYRRDRNELIRALWGRGVPQCLLSRVSGLSPVQIFRIVHNTKKGGDDNEH
jgi:hypothetical protein